MKSSKIWFLIAFLTIIIAFDISDLYTDITLKAKVDHLYVEAFMILVTALVIIYLIMQVVRQRTAVAGLETELRESKQLLQEQKSQMQEARKEYSEVIRKQFDEWNLTGSEIDTAYLLLKGLSFNEIAEVRGIKEKSVRQQASQIYQKANLPGRHAFAAWFFEDFMG
ncbi:helix-turn-helix transcriptional regulator [Kangiella sp. M94]